MSNAFFYDLLASVAERGRSMLKIKPWPKDAESRVEQLVDDCRALVEGRGEASGVALASEVMGRYRALDPSDHAAFFATLADDFGPDRARVRDAVAKFESDGDEAAASEIHYASEPRRHELFRRLNRAPGGTAALVAMRADLLQLLNQNPSLGDRRSRFSASVRFVVQSRLSGVAPHRLVFAGGASGKDHPLRGGA